MKIKEILKLIGLPAFVAGLCCFTPVVLVLLGLSTVSFAASLSDTLYFGYKWYFRGAGALLLSLTLFFYFRKKGICTLDQAKRNRNKIINTIIVVLIAGIIGYIIWLYVIVEIIGLALGIWG